MNPSMTTDGIDMNIFFLQRRIINKLMNFHENRNTSNCELFRKFRFS